MTDLPRVSRRTVLGGLAATGLGATGFSATGSAVTAPAGRGPRILVATNEPWGTYHVSPVMDEVARRGWQLTQLVPDFSEIDPDDPVPTALLDDPPPADLLVVTGAGDWPSDCAKRLGWPLPVAASSMAYLPAEQAPRADELQRRLRTVTSSSAAEGRAFSAYLGTRRRVRAVGSPQTDDLPEPAPEPGTVLVLTSVTYPDETGGAAPGTELLLACAERLEAAGKHVLVGLHPREDPALWDRYEISAVPSVQASARAEAAIGIPGTVFPLIVAAGVPVVGCVAARLDVPDYLLTVCSATLDDAGLAVDAVDAAELPDQEILDDVLGPIGGSSGRLLDAWGSAARFGVGVSPGRR